MAIATNTTEGQILIGGDLTGTGSSPQLKATGVTAGSYTTPRCIVDAKGRLVFCKSANVDDFTEHVLPNVPFATTVSAGKIIRSTGFSTSGILEAAIPTSTILGTIKQSAPLDINGDGVLSFTAANHIASAGTLGTIRVGLDMSITPEGVMDLTLPIASTSILGITRPLHDGGIQIDGASKISAAIPSSIVFGTIKPGAPFAIAGDGTLSFNPNTLIATAGTAGTVRVGSNLTISSPDGILSAPFPIASTSIAGIFSIDGTRFQVSGGALSARLASTTNKGLLSAGTNFSIASGIISANTATTGALGTVIIGNRIETTGDVISYSRPDATTSSKGLVQAGYGIEVSSGTLSVGIIPGTGFSISSGILSTALASKTVKGVMRIGSGFILSNIPGTAVFEPIPGSNTSKGVWTLNQFGTGFTKTSGVISATVADTSNYGTVQIGSGIDVVDGVISVLSSSQSATTSSKGVVQIGSGINVSSGVISISYPDASASVKGLVQIGSNISVSSGTISIPLATTSSLGSVQIDDLSGISISSGTVSIPYATTTTFGSIVGNATHGTNSNYLECASSYGIRVAITSASRLGRAQIGNNINVDGSGVISLPFASSTVAGAVKYSDADFYIQSTLLRLKDVANTTGATFTATQTYTEQNLGNVSGTVDISQGLSSRYIWMTATGATTLTAPTDLPFGKYFILVKTDGGTYTISTSGTLNPGGIWTSNTISSTDILILQYVGSNRQKSTVRLI